MATNEKFNKAWKSSWSPNLRQAFLPLMYTGARLPLGGDLPSDRHAGRLQVLVLPPRVRQWAARPPLWKWYLRRDDVHAEPPHQLQAQHTHRPQGHGEDWTDLDRRLQDSLRLGKEVMQLKYLSKNCQTNITCYPHPHLKTALAQWQIVDRRNNNDASLLQKAVHHHATSSGRPSRGQVKGLPDPGTQFSGGVWAWIFAWEISCHYIMMLWFLSEVRATVLGPEIILVRGLVKLVPAVAFNFCLNLAATFSQPCTSIISGPSRYWINL